MKRYWKLVTIAVVIVLVIGTFYIQSSMAASDDPEFMFKTVDGNEAELDSVALFGNYQIGTRVSDLKITKEGTEYKKVNSFLGQFNSLYTDEEIERLKTDYRNFMRGKTGSENLFFEDTSLIAYVNTDMKTSLNSYESTDFSFDISVLDKDTEKHSSFNIKLPESERYHSASVEKVYIDDGDMKILTNNFYYGNQTNYAEQVEYHVYQVDLADQKIVNDEVIAKTDGVSSDQQMELSLVEQSENADRNTKIGIVKKTLQEKVIDEWQSTYETIESELIVYDIVTSKQETLEIEEELLENLLVYNSGDTFYLTQETDEGLQVAAYNFETKELETKQTIPLSDSLPDYQSLYKIENDKLYIISPFAAMGTDAVISIADLKTGESLFEGTIEMKNPVQENMDYRLYFHDLEIN